MLQFRMKLLLLCMLITICYGCPGNLTTMTFNDGLKTLFGENNILIQDNGNSVYLTLDNRTGGSGFASQNPYKNGLFSALIKLPSQKYTAGIVVAFYLANNDTQHDEIDFEFLGHANRREWILQTNFYGNGSTGRGREERYKLWFNPGEEVHRYSIFWGESRITFYVDDVPIREIQNVDGLGGDYPSKPMSLYVTIWDASSWATNGGRYKINHKFDPYVAKISDFVIHGCSIDPIQKVSCYNESDYGKVCGEITPKILGEYEEFRRQYLTYSYCDDKKRYRTPLPEC